MAGREGQNYKSETTYFWWESIAVQLDLLLPRFVNIKINVRFTCFVEMKPVKQEVSHTKKNPLTM